MKWGHSALRAVKIASDRQEKKEVCRSAPTSGARRMRSYSYYSFLVTRKSKVAENDACRPTLEVEQSRMVNTRRQKMQNERRHQPRRYSGCDIAAGSKPV